MHHFKHSAATLATACTPTFSKTFPARPMKLVPPTVAGTVSDSIARIFGVELALSMGQPVIVKNKPGAGGIGDEPTRAGACEDVVRAIGAKPE